MVAPIKKSTPKYETNDLIWVKVGSYPYWPARVLH